MVQKEHLENFLRINCISMHAGKEEIRGALLYAQWHERDIDVALAIVEGAKVCDAESTASHVLMHAEGRLSRETLGSVPGIHTYSNAHEYDHMSTDTLHSNSEAYVHAFVVAILSILFAAAGGLFLLYGL